MVTATLTVSNALGRGSLLTGQSEEARKGKKAYLFIDCTKEVGVTQPPRPSKSDVQGQRTLLWLRKPGLPSSPSPPVPAIWATGTAPRGGVFVPSYRPSTQADPQRVRFCMRAWSISGIGYGHRGE